MNIININDKAIEAIFEGLKIYIDKKIESANYDKTRKGIITSINTNSTYNVSVDGVTYNNIKGVGVDCSVNDVVNIKVPNNNMSFMYIENF